MRQSNVRKPIRGPLAALFLVAAAGCGIDEGITWLPDSSGFVYTVHGVRLSYFDVAARKSRVLVEDTKSQTKWPAVSPDGKQVALAQIQYLKGQLGTFQLIRYDLNGKEVGRSPALPWTGMRPDRKKENETFLGSARLFWAPQHDKLIITEFSTGKSAILDVTNHRLIHLKGTPLVFGGTPFRPDGQGFLILKDHLALVNWQGQEELMALPNAGPETWRILRFAHEAASRWEGNTAVAIGHDWQIRVDTLKRTVTTVPNSQKAKNELIQSEFTFPEGGATVRSVAPEEVNINCKLLVLKPGAVEPKVLVNKGPFAFFPSPDQKLLAVRGVLGGVPQPIRVLNRQGEVIAEFPR